VRAHIQSRPAPFRNTNPPPRSPPQQPDHRQVAAFRQVSTLEAAVQGRKTPPPTTPQTEAHPSSRQEPSPTPVPATISSKAGGFQAGRPHKGDAAARVVLIGTGEGLGCMPKDERGMKLHMLMKRWMQQAAQPHLGPRIDAVGCVFLWVRS